MCFDDVLSGHISSKAGMSDRCAGPYKMYCLHVCLTVVEEFIELCLICVFIIYLTLIYLTMMIKMI
jgi:hypothetical protein